MPTYKLSYFNSKGRAEVSRWLFFAAGQPFEDERLEGETWQKFKPDTPFGCMPVLTVDGELIAQSNAIARFLANKFGFAGETDLEKAKADMVVDGVEDLLKPLIAIHFEKGDEAKKAEMKKKFEEETLPFFLGKFEKMVVDNGSKGLLVGNKVTWADMVFVSISDYLKDVAWDKYPNLQAVKDQVHSIPAIKDWIARRPVTET